MSKELRNRSPKEKSRDLGDWVGKEKAQQISHLFDKVEPVFHALGQVLNVIWPFILLAWEKANALWIALQPYHPLELSNVFLGFFMAFFGSHYLLLLAAVEAARQTGYQGFKENLAIIYDHFEEVYRQNLLDNQKDDDKDGIKDVDELSRKDLFTRKFKLLLRVTDPNTLGSAFSGLWIAFLAVIASLRMQFAQTLTLGASIGSVIEAPLKKFAAPTISAGIAPEYRSWVPFGITQFSRFIGCSIAFLVTRIIGGFYAAIKGGQIFATGLIAYLVKYRYVNASHADHGIMYMGIVAAVFIVGFYVQLNTFFGGLPFPINFLLLPASIAEKILMYFVSSSVQTGAQS